MVIEALPLPNPECATKLMELQKEIEQMISGLSYAEISNLLCSINRSVLTQSMFTQTEINSNPNPRIINPNI